MSTPWPVLTILIVYYIFVQKIGPKMMENREPMNIKHIMMTYNLGQTVYNTFIVSAVSVHTFKHQTMLHNTRFTNNSYSYYKRIKQVI